MRIRASGLAGLLSASPRSALAPCQRIAFHQSATRDGAPDSLVLSSVADQEGGGMGAKMSEWRHGPWDVVGQLEPSEEPAQGRLFRECPAEQGCEGRHIVFHGDLGGYFARLTLKEGTDWELATPPQSRKLPPRGISRAKIDDRTHSGHLRWATVSPSCPRPERDTTRRVLVEKVRHQRRNLYLGDVSRS